MKGKTISLKITFQYDFISCMLGHAERAKLCVMKRKERFHNKLFIFGFTSSFGYGTLEPLTINNNFTSCWINV